LTSKETKRGLRSFRVTHFTTRGNVAGMESPAIFRHEFTVPAEVIDTNGHVNNVAFVQWMQDVAIRHFEALGGVEPMRAAGGAWVARSHHVEYLAPGFANELIRVKTWIADVGRVRSLRKYEFWRGDKLLVRGETDWVFVNAGTGKPLAIPQSIIDALTRANIS
jgi:acyl-CoA thioester hydrolase